MFEIIQRTTVFKTPWFSLQEKVISGHTGSPYYSIQCADYVCVVAMTKEGELVLVRQYRPAVEAYMLELPSGLVDAGESPNETAARELLEETGFRAASLELLGKLRPDTGRLENRLWCYFTLVEDVRDEPKRDAGELGLETVLMPVSEFLSTCGREDGCVHAQNLAPVALALINGRLR